MGRQLQFRPDMGGLARELEDQVRSGNTVDEGAPPPTFVSHAPPPPAPPPETQIAAQKAAAVVENADQLESKIHRIIDTVKQRAEQIERQGLAILSELSDRRAAFQKNADAFLETTGKWQTGLRELFAQSIDKKDAA